MKLCLCVIALLVLSSLFLLDTAVATKGKGAKHITVTDLFDEEIATEEWEEIEDLAEDIVDKKQDKSKRNSKGNSFRKQISFEDENESATRLEQEYNGVPVFGQSVTVFSTEEGEKQLFDKVTGAPTQKIHLKKERKVAGYFLTNLKDIFGDEIDETAMDELKDDVFDKTVNKTGGFKGQKKPTSRRKRAADGEEVGTSKPIIYVDPDTHDAVPAYLLTMKNDKGRPWMYIVDEDGEILKDWSPIYTHNHNRFRREAAVATGVGGNANAGKWTFGTDKPALEVTKDGTTCKLETAKVKTVNGKGYKEGQEEAVLKLPGLTFPCSVSTAPAANGAYGVMNDIHYYATLTVDMFNTWFKTTPFKTMPIVAVAHMADANGGMSENAYYAGHAPGIYIGDGGQQYHPMILDTIAHEIGHGVTAESSDLGYYGVEAGGLNEGFSDALGLASFYYEDALKAKNTNKGGNFNFVSDWTASKRESKTNKPMRYFEDPTKDGYSIAHTKDYRQGMDPHLHSGIFNKLFFLVSKGLPNGLWDAMDIFYIANTKFWQSATTYAQCGSLTLRAAEEMKAGKHFTHDYTKLDISVLVDAMKEVGIHCTKTGVTWGCTSEVPGGATTTTSKPTTTTTPKPATTTLKPATTTPIPATTTTEEEYYYYGSGWEEWEY